MRTREVEVYGERMSLRGPVFVGGYVWPIKLQSSQAVFFDFQPEL